MKNGPVETVVGVMDLMTKKQREAFESGGAVSEPTHLMPSRPRIRRRGDRDHDDDDDADGPAASSLPSGTQRVRGGTTSNLVSALQTLPQLGDVAGGEGTAPSAGEAGGRVRTGTWGQTGTDGQTYVLVTGLISLSTSLRRKRGGYSRPNVTATCDLLY